MARKYHVIAVNNRTGKKTYMTSEPVTHREGCTIISKITRRPQRRVQLEEIGGRRRRLATCPI